MADSPNDPTPAIAPRAPGLIERVQAILLRPSPTWDVIATEAATVKSLYTGYILPLAAIGPVATIIGLSVFGAGFMGITWRPAIQFLLLSGIVTLILNLAMVYVMALIIDALAPSFDGRKNFLQAFKLSTYAMTAAWVAGIFSLIPMLGFLGILGLYSLYLLYLGIPKLMGAPKEKSLGYTVVAVIVSVVLWIIIGAISSVFTAPGMMAGMAGGRAASDGGRVTGNVTIPGVGSVDIDKMQQGAEQMAAQASAMAAGTQTVTVVDAQSLLGLMPGSYMGAARADDSTQSGGVAGVAASGASARYEINGQTVNLRINDLGSASGLGTFAAAMNVNASSSSATGYSKITTVNGQMISEEYDRDSKYGSYAVVRNGRISVEASGTVDSIDVLKNLVNSLDAGRLEALSKG